MSEAEAATASEVASEAAPSTAGGASHGGGMSRMTRKTGRTRRQSEQKNKQLDFFVCTGLLLLTAILCAIGVIVIHFAILPKEFFSENEYNPGAAWEMLFSDEHPGSTTKAPKIRHASAAP